MAIHSSRAAVGACKELLDLLLPIIGELEEADPFHLLHEQTDPLMAPDYQQYVALERDVWLGLIRQRATQGYYSSGAQLHSDVLQMQQNVVAYNLGPGRGMAANPHLAELATALLQLASDRLKQLEPQLAPLLELMQQDLKANGRAADGLPGPAAAEVRPATPAAPSAPAQAGPAAAVQAEGDIVPGAHTAAAAAALGVQAAAAGSKRPLEAPGVALAVEVGGSNGICLGPASPPLNTAAAAAATERTAAAAAGGGARAGAAVGAGHGDVNGDEEAGNPAKRPRRGPSSGGGRHQARTKADSPFLLLPASFAANHRAELEALRKPALLSLAVVVDGVPLQQSVVAKVESRETRGEWTCGCFDALHEQPSCECVAVLAAWDQS